MTSKEMDSVDVKHWRSSGFRFFTCLLVLWTLLSSFTNKEHEYYVSVAYFEYNPASKSWEISIKIFTDDLEKALESKSGKTIRIDHNSKHEKLIEEYIKANVSWVATSNTILPLQYIGKEIEADAVWIYLETPQAKPLFQGSSLKNTILLETYDSQVNMVTVKVGNEKKTYLFKKNRQLQSL